MKKLLWISLLLAACNSGDKPADKQSASTAAPSSGTSVAAGGCNKMIFFKEGAEIDSKTYDGNGKETGSQHTKIVSVNDDGGITVATAQSTDTAGSGKPFEVNYKCDGKKIYVDVASVLNNAAKNKSGKFEATPVEYPIDITEGETLPDMDGTMNMEANGKTTRVKYHFKNRKVEGKEDITTPAGTFSCYKITNSVETEMDMPGMTEQMKKVMETMKDKFKMSSVTWFAPSFGILKSETYLNGKLQSSNEIVGYKE